MKASSLEWALVLLAFLCFLGLGRRFRSLQQNSPESFWLANRNSPWWLLLASIVATETSTLTFLSVPGLAYSGNLSWMQVALGFVLGRYLVAFWLLPGYFRGKFFTAYELLQQRFGRKSQQLAAALFLATRTLADGLRLFLTAIVVEELLGLPLELAVLLVSGVTVAYTSAGGLRAVLWADLIQLGIYLAGAALTFGVLLERLPHGWTTLIQFGSSAGRFTLFDFSFSWKNPWTFWAGVFGGCVLSLSSHGVDQLMVQRYLAARSLPDARRALVGSGWFVFGQFAFFLVLGVGLAAFYAAFPPDTPLDRSDRVLLRFVVEELPVGGGAVLLGAILAAAMSTLSSSLHSCATSWCQDIRTPRLRSEPFGERPLPLPPHPGVFRATVWGFALAQTAIALLAKNLTESLITAALSIASLTGGPLLGLFLLGRLSPNLREQKALLALASGVGGVLAAYALTPLAWTWYAALGCSVTLTVGLLLAARFIQNGHEREKP